MLTPQPSTCSDHTGWAWFIPLNGTTSIGIVMDQKAHNEKCKSPLPPTSKMLDRYLSNLSLAPGVVKLITSSGKLTPGSVKSASDFSYAANRYGGDGYRIIGDAGGTSNSPEYYSTHTSGLRRITQPSSTPSSPLASISH